MTRAAMKMVEAMILIAVQRMASMAMMKRRKKKKKKKKE
jgi:hypothetical protein